MPKRFEFKLPRLISSSLQICHSRNPSSFPEDPLPNEPGCRRLSTINPKANEIGSPEPLPSMPQDSFCVGEGHPDDQSPEEGSRGGQHLLLEYSWWKDSRWHVVNKRVDHEADDNELEPVMVGRCRKSKGAGDGAVVGKRDAALVSMRVFSGKYGSCSKTKTLLSYSRRFWKEEEEHGEVASVLVLRRTTSMKSGGKVRDRVAAVKRSENHLDDFKTSMIKMVVERRMFEARNLERHLRSFLSLNSKEYHGIIAEASSESWQKMFCNDSAEFTEYSNNYLN